MYFNVLRLNKIRVTEQYDMICNVDTEHALEASKLTRIATSKVSFIY